MEAKNVPAIGPDCKNCIHRGSCTQVNAAPGNFCTSYRSKKPPERKPEDSPAARWARGEDVDI